MFTKKYFLAFIFIYLSLYGTVLAQQSPGNIIDLSGAWHFKLDSTDAGEKEQWFNKNLTDKITLPGSLTTNNIGNDISLNTQWTGDIVDSSFFKKPEYAKYRQPNNFKIPFWLQPIKYYKGAAWYPVGCET